MAESITLKNGEILYNGIGVLIPKILLPKDKTEVGVWGTVACDQFTSQPEYWENAEKTVGGKHSALRLVLPEYFLGSDDEEQKISDINASMDEYLAEGFLAEREPGIILVRRTPSGKKTRTGIVLALDLEKYDFKPGEKPLIRATEGTVTSRIPPRMKIRKNASLELPHILVLIDDRKKTVIEKISEFVDKNNIAPCYGGELMLGGGHISGFSISDKALLNEMANALDNLKGTDEKPFLFAVGDGNHSLATAKCHWEELKKNGAPMDHPARFALCEIENINDDGIEFEPIHRVVFNADYEEFTDSISEFFGENASYAESFDDEITIPGIDDQPYHRIQIFCQNTSGNIYVDKKAYPLAVGAIQEFLDDYVKFHDAKIDYIHGFEATEGLGKGENAIGILLPPMEKSTLYDYVDKKGALPRKTFSMGEAEEKRYYIECRKIK